MRFALHFLVSILTIFAVTAASASAGISNSFSSQPMLTVDTETQFFVQDRGLGGITLDIILPPSIDQIDDVNALPFISRWVAIPERVIANVSVTSQEGRRVSFEHNIDFPTYINDWDTDINELDDITFKDTSPVIIGKPAALRGISMVPIIVQPVQALDRPGMVFENRNITVELEFTPDENASGFNRRIPYSAQYARMLDNILVNPPTRDLAPTERASILITYSDLMDEDEEAEDMLNEIEAFAEWKRRLGYEVFVEPIDVEQDPDDIKGIIENYYEDHAIEFLIILGHYNTDYFEEDSPYFFPTYVDTIFREEDILVFGGDPYFVTFDFEFPDGGDYIPDVIVGRFMCPTEQDLSYALSRSIGYEQDPEEGDWLSRAVYAIEAPDSGLAPEVSALDVGYWSLPQLEYIGYTEIDTIWPSIRLHEVAELIRESISEGASLTLGEGWLYGTVVHGDPIEDNINIWEIEDSAEVGRMHPFWITNAEHYLEPIMFDFFNSGSEDDPNGSVAGYGFWFEPYTNQSSYIIGWSVWGMRNMNEYTGGYLFQFAGLRWYPMMEILNEDEIDRWKLIESYRYLGDPTIQIRTSQPIEMTVNHPEAFNIGATMVSLTITDNEDEPVSGAVVCIRQEEVFQFVSETTGDGSVIFTVPDGLEEGELQITTSKHNCIPYINDVEVSEQRVNIVLEDGGFDDDDDELFANGETVELELTLRNTGNQNARNLSAAFSSDNEFLTFSRDDAEIEDINANQTGTPTQQVEMTLNPDCPFGTVLQIQVDVSSGNDHWLTAFEITTSGPSFVIDELNTENIEIGRNGTISPGLINDGDLNSTALQATLSCNTPGVTVLQAERNYPVIENDVDEITHPNQPFTVEISDIYIPGRSANFELQLSGEDESDATLTYSIAIGEAVAGDPLGPDNHGYVCFDSDDEDWRDHPNYEWREINPNVPGFEFEGTRMEIEPDTTREYLRWDISKLVPLPFEFQYYGETYDSIVVCTNGWLAMGTDMINRNSPSGWRIPGIGAPDAQICPYWLDLENFEPARRGIFYHHIENEGIFILEWSDLEVRTVEGPYHLIFQVLLFDPEMYVTESGDGEIVFQYHTYASVRGPFSEHPYPVIGISSPDGNDGLLYSWRNNEDWDAPVQANEIRNEFAIKFTTDVQYVSGSVAGRVVRSENQEIAIPDAVVYAARTDPVEVDEEGRFQIEALRAGRYACSVKAIGFNTLIDTFEVISGEEVQLDPFMLTHPEPNVDGDTLTRSIRPDHSRTRVDVLLQNNGNGPLDYSAEVRDIEGNEHDYEVLNHYGIYDALHGEEINDSIRAYAPLYVDSLFYIPFEVRIPNLSYIAVMNLEGERLNLVAPPIDYGTGRIKSLAWDGEFFWGSYRDSDESVSKLIRFNLEDTISVEIEIPFENYNCLPIFYSPERQSIYVTDPNEDILELNRDGEILSRWHISFPGRDNLINGFGWNNYDIDGMPLYMIDTYEMESDETRALLIKMNPDNGHYKEVGYIENMREESNGGYGMTIMVNYDYRHCAFAMVENLMGARRASDILVIRELGMNFTMMVPNSFQNMHGTIPAGGAIEFGFEVEANGWPEGDYYWSYFINHNALGDPITVPVKLTVDNNSDLGDGNENLPVEFALKSIYPYPFNNVTRITFSVDRNAHTAIHAYDLSGRHVATVYDDIPSVGNHAVSWDASIMPSGLYLIRLESEGRFSAKKIVLMK